MKKKLIDYAILKGFFRRSIKEREPIRYKCLENNNCEINASTRSLCRSCRYSSCIKNGMSAHSMNLSISIGSINDSSINRFYKFNRKIPRN